MNKNNVEYIVLFGDVRIDSGHFLFSFFASKRLFYGRLFLCMGLHGRQFETGLNGRFRAI